MVTSNDLIARCLKITEKVSFNIASEASYVYILSGQKLIKNAKSGQFCEFFRYWSKVCFLDPYLGTYQKNDW